MKKRESRRITPWDEATDLTPTQEFLKQHYHEHYAERHVIIRESEEAALINSHMPAMCPHCNGDRFKKFGHTSSGVQRTGASVGKHSCLLPEQSSTNIESQSVNGWNTV
jgi:hypothetical protein